MGKHERGAYKAAAWWAVLSILAGLELARTDEVAAAIVATLFACLAAAYACEAAQFEEDGQ